MQTAATLQPLKPAFVSVTYGAGGSTRARTLDVVIAMKRELNLEVMAHLTCVNSSVSELRTVLDHLKRTGIDNVLALRGDPPKGQQQFQTPPDGLAHASDLVKLVVSEFGLCVGGACYPEKHLEAVDLTTDIRWARAKVAAGARFLITQLFFDNERYFSFVRRARQMGISVPIIPGIMPITNTEQVKRFTEMCGAAIPAKLLAELDRRKDDPEAVLDLGVAYATLQCVDLLARGAPAIHFYTLNKSPASRAVVSALLAAEPWKRKPSSAARLSDDPAKSLLAFRRPSNSGS